MNRTNITQRIENPNLCTINDVADFVALIEKYPYAQSFPILLLKTLGQAKDIHFEEALNQHAYRISDRMNLYYLINAVSENYPDEKVIQTTTTAPGTFLKKEGEQNGLEPLKENESPIIEQSQLVEKTLTSEDLAVTLEEIIPKPTVQIEEKPISQNSSESNDEKSTAVQADSETTKTPRIIRLDYEELLNEDIKFAKVEEMTFEPVIIHAKDVGEIEITPSENPFNSEESTKEDGEITEATAEAEHLESSLEQMATSLQQNENTTTSKETDFSNEAVSEEIISPTNFTETQENKAISSEKEVIEAEVKEILLEKETRTESNDLLDSSDVLKDSQKERIEAVEISNTSINDEFTETERLVEPIQNYDNEAEAEGPDMEVSGEQLVDTSQEEEEISGKATAALAETVGSDIDGETTEYDEKKIQTVSLAFFDPTLDIDSYNTVEDLVILEASSFEQEKKEVSLELIEKTYNTIDDELTSNALAQGFHITLQDTKEIKNISDSEAKKHSIAESIANFEHTNSTEKRSFNSWLHASESKLLVDEKNERSTEIIEKFIQEDPRISRASKDIETEEKKKTPFFKATEIAKESLKENGIPVSVTLAKIFASQGNFPNAIHTYEQLMLVYPEKKSFFANQIKELKKKLNN